MHLDKRPLLYGGLIISTLIGIEIIAILNLNGGMFTYTLDDPYIHLALADNIAAGHYGLNASEFSAPSSSILWPFILAATSGLPLRHLHPLVINLAFAAGTFFLVWKLLSASIKLDNQNDRLFFITLLLVVICLGTNFIGIPLNGMEHSAQVFFVVTVFWGLILYVTEDQLPQWLILALILSPLIRYENLPLSGAAILFLFSEKQVKPALIASAGIILSVGGFSLFLLNLDLGVLPTSILAKTTAGTGSLWQMPVEGFYSIFSNFRATLLFGVLLLALGRFFFYRDRFKIKKLIIVVILTILAHLLFGRYGWYHRYEIYVWTLGLLSIVFIYGDSISRFLSNPAKTKWGLLFALLALFLLGAPYLFGLTTIPTAANNIYEQQYQMHRFAVDFYKKPIAVNDVGYVAFQNESYVLDLWGLASAEALSNRTSAEDPLWMDRLATRYDTQLIMIYEQAFPVGIPRSWVKVGQLQLSRPNIIVVDSVVDFYAKDETASIDIMADLETFAQTLPPNVRFIPADQEQ